MQNEQLVQEEEASLAGKNQSKNREILATQTRIVSKPVEIPSLTGLRFWAAFAIVIHHLTLSSLRNLPGGSFRSFLGACGTFGMSLFFVMSGFIIYYNYYDKVKTLELKPIAKFIAARISRLYPLFIAFFVLDFSYYGYSVIRNGGAGIERALAFPFFVTMTQSWLYTLVGGFPVTLPFGFSNISWSISAEFLLYLVFPLVAVAISGIHTTRARIVFFVGALVLQAFMKNLIFINQGPIDRWAGVFFGDKATIGGNAAVYAFYTWLDFNSPYVRFFEFLIGVSIGHLYSAKRDTTFKSSEKLLMTSLTSISLLYIVAVFTSLAPQSVMKLYYILGFSMPLGIIIYYLLRCDGFLRKTFENKHFVNFGETSYSIYLLHPLIALLFGAIPFGPNYALMATGLVALQLVAVLVVSNYSYKFLEAPARTWLRKKLNAGR